MSPSKDPHPFTGLAAGYFAVQGAAGAVWWLAMFVSPRVESLFSRESFPGGVHLFLAADVTLFVLGSWLASFGLRRSSTRAIPLCWMVCGAAGYAGLICLQGALTREIPALCAVLMLPVAMLTLHATLLATGEFPFRVSRTPEPRMAFLRAMVQTAIFYGLFFGGIPWLILRAQRELGWPRFDPGVAGRMAACLGFVLGGTLAVRSTVSFAWRGKGTPLPTEAPRELVTTGPYAFVRNPMACGGIFQGIMIGLALGSVPVMLYSLSGALIWHLLVRPVEEADLRQRFGVSYGEYCHKVSCWVPRQFFPPTESPHVNKR